MAKMQLKDVAYARSGDKSDISTIGILALNSNYYKQLKRELTPEKVKAFFKDMAKGDVTIYPKDNMVCFQVICRVGLNGGATRTLRFDQTGKSMVCVLLRMEVEII